MKKMVVGVAFCVFVGLGLSAHAESADSSSSSSSSTSTTSTVGTTTAPTQPTITAPVTPPVVPTPTITSPSLHEPPLAKALRDGLPLRVRQEQPFDVNNDNYLEPDEIRAFLKSVAQEAAKAPVKNTSDILYPFDKNKDGYIDRSEAASFPL